MNGTINYKQNNKSLLKPKQWPVFKRKKLKWHMSTFLTVLVRVVCDSYSIDFFI